MQHVCYCDMQDTEPPHTCFSTLRSQSLVHCMGTEDEAPARARSRCCSAAFSFPTTMCEHPLQCVSTLTRSLWSCAVQPLRSSVCQGRPNDTSAACDIGCQPGAVALRLSHNVMNLSAVPCALDPKPAPIQMQSHARREIHHPARNQTAAQEGETVGCIIC